MCAQPASPDPASWERLARSLSARAIPRYGSVNNILSGNFTYRSYTTQPICELADGVQREPEQPARLAIVSAPIT
jgi:hypothetical protein